MLVIDDILPELFLGPCPRRPEDIDDLHQEGITAVLSLQTDTDLKQLGIPWSQLKAHYTALEMEIRRVPVRDFDDRDLYEKLPEAVHVLAELREAQHTVYVHCTAGVNRSPSVVICYLHWCLRWCLAEAERHVQKYHPCAPETQVINQATRDRRQAKG